MNREMPAALRAAVADTVPVRPVEPASAGSVRAALGAALAGVAVHWIFVLRPDHEVLGPVLLWGGSALELGLGLALLFVAFRETTPDRRPPAPLLPALAGAGLVAHGMIATLSRWRSPVDVAAGSEGRTGALCAILVVTIGAVIGIGALMLLRIGLSPRPTATALGVGLGAGLAADAVWRTICPYTEPAHLLGSHGVGVAVVTLVLGLAGRRWLRGLRRGPSRE